MSNVVRLALKRGLTPKAGFDWSKVRWGAPDAPVSGRCSYCQTKIGDDEPPLRLFSDKGDGAVFCRACQKEWWGLEEFDDEQEPA